MTIAVYIGEKLLKPQHNGGLLCIVIFKIVKSLGATIFVRSDIYSNSTVIVTKSEMNFDAFRQAYLLHFTGISLGLALAAKYFMMKLVRYQCFSSWPQLFKV